MPAVASTFGIRDLRQRLEQAGQPTLARQINEVCAAAALRELQRQFRAGVDPYGKAWALPAGRPGGVPMRDTGRLANSFVYEITEVGFAITTEVVYAQWLQAGTHAMEPRIMLPESSDRLSATRYAAVINRAADKVFRDHFAPTGTSGGDGGEGA